MEVVASTRSGCSATMASRLGFCGSPTCGFNFAAGRRVAVICVACEPVLEPQRVNSFRQIRSERHDSAHIGGDRHAPANFIGNDARSLA